MSTFYAVDTKGGAPRRLIHNIPVWNLTVSPDGSRIAFLSDKSGTSQIWIADASGANARQLTHAGNVGAPAFTPDGRSIIFINFDESQYAWRMPVDGSAPPVRLTNAPTSRALPSPDGAQLLVRLRSRDPKTPLWRTAVMPMSGGEPRYFDAPRFGGRLVVQWHPNGRAFVYLDDKDGISNVWMQDLDGGAPRQLTFFDSAEIFTFDLSNDGKSVALARGESTRDAVLIENFR
jgi:Tol biopolymer transport system component